MKNVTVTMNEDVARWTRVHAAQQGKSVSRMLSELVERHMQEEQGYEAAMRQHLARERRALREDGDPPAREALYDRGSTTWARPR